jgi:serine/threonine protein kinase
MSAGRPGEIPGFLMVGGVGVGSRIAGYKLEKQIGQGGMAVVFRARDERLGRLIAVKILAPAAAADEAFRKRFIRESRAAAAVDDPYIIPVFEAGESDGVFFIAMRHVSGGDVGTLVRSHGPLSPGRAAAILSPVASALDAAHEAGLVHRDVKPTNMLLDVRPGRPDHVYLSDFGLSKDALSSLGLTGSGSFLGTPDYVAPEQIAGDEVDGRADQYALACTAFEMLSAAPPFRRDHGMAVIYAHTSAAPPALTSVRPDLPAAIDAVLAKALAKAPTDRYATCRDFAESLRAALNLPRYDVEPGSSPRLLSTVAARYPTAEFTAPERGQLPSPDKVMRRFRRTALALACAVALFGVGFGLSTVLERAQHRLPSPLPPLSGWLRGVASLSTTGAWIAGRYCQSGCQMPHEGKDRPLTRHWNGTTWSAVATPDPGISSWLRAISAAPADTAWAVGGSCVSGCATNNDTVRTLILHWNGSNWARVSSPSPGVASLIGIDVGPSGTAWAVGSSCVSSCAVTSSAADRTLILRWDGTRWTQVRSPSPGNAFLASVSAGPDGRAWAVGYSCASACGTRSTIDRTLILRWDGTRWTRVRSPSPGNAFLASVSAAPDGRAWAVGYSCAAACRTASEVDQTLILRWDGTTWSDVVSPSYGRRALLSSVLATGSGTAWAVGYSCVSACDTASEKDKTLLLRWNGTAWVAG